VFNVNTWLAKKGYLFWSEAAANQEKQTALLGVGQVARHTWLLDWTRTRAFATTPTSNGINIVVSEDGTGPGVPAAEYQAFRNQLIEELREVRSPEDGEKIISGIFTREEIFPGPSGHLGPDITLEMRDGGLISILPGEDIVSQRPVVSGAHRPLGIFGARGPGVKKGFDAGEISILDVAPTILYSLGLPVYKDLEGRVPQEIFEKTMLEEKPVKVSATSATGDGKEEEPEPEVDSETAEMSEEDERVVMERLRELGYIE
jgi:predicted AlkP superfamily phosphohydrolase/phosphomutase